MTRRWRETDSNPRSPARETTLRDCLLIEEVRFAPDSLVEEGDLPPMIKRKKAAITPRDTVVVQCLQGKRSTVLALSRTLCAGSAGAAAFAAASCVSDMSDSLGVKVPCAT